MCENTRKHDLFDVVFTNFNELFSRKSPAARSTNERTNSNTRPTNSFPMGCDCRLFQARFESRHGWVENTYYPLRIRKKTLKGRVSSFWGPIDTPTLSFWGSFNSPFHCRVEWSWGSVLFGGQKAYVHERKWKWLVCHIICCYILNQCDSTGSQRPFQSKVPLEWLINNPP